MTLATLFACELSDEVATPPLTSAIERFSVEAFAELMDDEFDKVRYELGYVIIDIGRTRYWCDPDGNCYRVVFAT